MSESRASDLLTREIRVVFGDHQVTLPLGALGFTYDQRATMRRALAARHQGSLWQRLAAWVISPLAAETVEEVWHFDAGGARRAFDDHPGFTPVVVDEPSVDFFGVAGMVATPGVMGLEADGAGILAQLETIDLLRPPEWVPAETRAIHPSVTDAEATEVADRLDALTSEGVSIYVGDRSGVLTPFALRTSIEVAVGEGRIDAVFAADRLQETLERTVIGPVGEFIKPVMNVEGDRIETLVAGAVPPECCREGSGEILARALMKGRTGPFVLSSRPNQDPELQAWSDGSLIVEKVGEFTTPHACCENRVVNIQRMADMMRGFYLLPGETLSLNEYIGPRTRANGFVSAGAIRQGHMTLEVGGGVSQFATTIFNAAYFAGLDIDSYQSHSVHFSRYPYGREATISSPAPDLVMTNVTDHPILIWTSYTPNSITVSMYSTKSVEVVELEQRTYRGGQCRHVETDRQRTFSDGRVRVDTFVANYRPGEGIDCSGNPIPRPPT
jgi:hypothetical protein